MKGVCGLRTSQLWLSASCGTSSRNLTLSRQASTLDSHLLQAKCRPQKAATRSIHLVNGPKDSFGRRQQPGRQQARDHPRRQKTEFQFSPHLALFTAFTIAAGISNLPLQEHPIQRDDPTADTAPQDRNIRLADVPKHGAEATRKWIVSGTRVYDITDFIEAHPGGQVILRACGGSIDSFWKIFAIHQKPEVREILEQYYIGDLDSRDVTADGSVDWKSLGPGLHLDIDDPFSQDPAQDQAMIFHTKKPCNAEAPPDLLTKYFITPLRYFFVRNHLWVPDIHPQQHQLTIEFSNGEETLLSLQEIKTTFQPHTITATLQCAGNRRAHMSANPTHGQTSGLQWDIGAISTATFTGARLSEVLRHAGYDAESSEDAHIHFTAPSDTYSASIPLSKALDPDCDVLLAYDMNEQPMDRTHGGPLRVIVPGVTAARSVKWVGHITISAEESDSQWQRRDYKVFPPSVKAVDVKPADWDDLPSIQETGVQSAITSVKRAPTAVVLDDNGADQQVPNSTTTRLSGFAFSGGGRMISRVEVSMDGGKTWSQARIRQDEAKGSRRWAWVLWDADLDTSGCELSRAGEAAAAEYVVRAVDEAGNTQPANFEATWNFRGLMANAWHRVRSVRTF